MNAGTPEPEADCERQILDGIREYLLRYLPNAQVEIAGGREVRTQSAILHVVRRRGGRSVVLLVTEEFLDLPKAEALQHVRDLQLAGAVSGATDGDEIEMRTDGLRRL